jgi:hypothetical protein
VETASTYFTRRARQERANAVAAASAEARKAHLELAFRLVRVATAPAAWASSEYWSVEVGVVCNLAAGGQTDMSDALTSAFPLPRADGFERLLEAADTTTR